MSEVKKVLTVIKNVVFISFGLLLFLGAIAMIKEDITSTIFFGVIGLIFIFFGKDLILNQIQINRKKNFMTDIQNIEKQKSIIEDKTNNLNMEISNLINIKEKLEKETSQLYDVKSVLDMQIKKREDFFVSTELKYIDTLNGLEFEKYTGQLLSKLGYKTEVTKASQDSGGDIIAEKDDIKYVFQCKNYSDTVGNKAIQEVYAAKGIYQCDRAIVITNNFFTKQAQEEANVLNILLWDRNIIKTLLYKAYSFDLLHIDFLQKQDEQDDNEELDIWFDDAVKAVIETGQASASFIQSRYKIGYARAGKIIDQMEERGVISGYQGSKPREVLMTKERWQQLHNEIV